MRLNAQLIIVVLLSGICAAQEYTRWWQYETRVRKMSTEEFRIVRMNAEKGDVDSEMLLAVAYQQGFKVERNNSEYLVWVQRSAEHGSPEAQYTLSNLYKKGTEAFPADSKKVVYWVRKAAEQGHFVAEYNLGSYLMDGMPPLAMDVSLGEMWILKSAEAGFPHAQFMLGMFYLRGTKLPVDPEKAESWLRKAAEHGHVLALTELARLYSNSEDVPRDPDFVETMLLRGSEMGRAEPQFFLGRMYRKGYFGRVDFPRALEWLELSANKKYAPASFLLAEMHEKGEGMSVNASAAAQFYLQAATLGYSPAVCKAGEIYRLGHGVPQDNSIAYKWFMIGARLGAPECATGQKRMESELKDEERERVTTETEAWIASHPFEMSQPVGNYKFPQGVWVSDDPPAELRGPSTEEERTKVIKMVRELEMNPLGKDARDTTIQLWGWIQEVPDIFYVHCNHQLLEKENEKGKSAYQYRRPLEWQIYFSGAAYQLQHLNGKDQLAIYHAGVLGALQAYEAILADHPHAHWPLMDDLLDRRNQGSLPEYVHAQANKNCR